MKKNFKVLICFAIFFGVITTEPNISRATENGSEANTYQIIEEQKESFGISDFIKETKKYGGEFLEDTDISEMLNSAIAGNIDNNQIYRKILKIFGTEIKGSITTLISILIIVVLHSILKAISDNLENDNISKIIYYAQYVLIVTIIMSNFTGIIKMIKDTASNLVGFMNALIPILITLMTYTGSIVTGGLLQPIILFMINFLANTIQNILIPLVLITAALSIISKISEKVQITKITKFFKSSITWFLGIALTIFVGVVSLEGTLSSSIDGITAKTAKAAVSSIIPVVGKVLGDVVDSVLGCGVILKNAVGIVGIIVVIGICIAPVIKLGTLTIIYNLTAGIIEPVADGKIVKLLEEMGGIFKLLFAILCSLSVMLIIGVTLVIKISNSGMMYK